MSEIAEGKNHKEFAMATRTPEGTWRAVVRVKNRKYSENFRTKARAEAWAQRVKDGGSADVNTSKPSPTVEEFFEGWLKDYGTIELADSTVSNLEAIARKHLFPHWGRLPIASIEREDCLDLRAKLKGTITASYANNVMNLAKKLFKIAAQDKVIKENPWPGVKRLKVPPRQFSYWSIAERDKALAYLEKHDPAFGELVTLAVHTGLRWGELYALERGAVDYRLGLITVRANYRPSVKRVANRAKSGRLDVVPMNVSAGIILESRRHLADDARSFDPKLLEAARYRLQSLAKETGVKQLRFHDLRHTFASNLREAGVDLDTVRQLMRHANLEMTLIYAHIGNHDLTLAVDKLAPKSVPDLSPMPPKGLAEQPILQVISGGKKIGPIVKWTKKRVS